MKNQWAVITGGASGIGNGIAKDLASQGVNLVIIDIRDQAFDTVTKELVARGAQCLCYQADVTDISALQTIQQDLVQRQITVHYLVTAAGILQSIQDIADFDLVTHDRVWRVNYHGTYHACKVWIEPMRAAGQGSIVVVSSIMSMRGSPLLAYGPAKAALNNLVSGLAVKVAPDGIRINAVAPGFTMTEGLEEKIKNGERDGKRVLHHIPMNRYITTDEVARAARFLLSDDASAITGATLPVDGGWLSATGWMIFGELPGQASGDDDC